MFDRKNIKRYYLNSLRKIRSFLLSAKSRELLVFCFFVFVAFCFWLLQTMNDIYQADFKIPVRLKNVPKEIVMTSELPKEIRVHVEDRGTVLLNYMLGRTFFPVSFDFQDYKDNGFHVSIPVSEVTKKVSAQLASTTKLLSVRPNALEFIYTEGKAKKVKGLSGSGNMHLFGIYGKPQGFQPLIELRLSFFQRLQGGRKQQNIIRVAKIGYAFFFKKGVRIPQIHVGKKGRNGSARHGSMIFLHNLRAVHYPILPKNPGKQSI